MKKIRRLRDKVDYVISELKKVGYKLPVDNIEYIISTYNRLAAGIPMCIIRIMKHFLKLLPISVIQNCYGNRLDIINPYSFIQLTFKLMVFLTTIIIESKWKTARNTNNSILCQWLRTPKDGFLA